MSRFGESLPLYAAEAAARDLRDYLRPVCVRIEIAGSIRRQAQTVGDIELVAVPIVEDRAGCGQLFAAGDDVDCLHEAMTKIVGAADDQSDFAPVARFGRKPAWGFRQKQFAYRHRGRWFPVDLYTVTRDQWGCHFAIRTGNADFARLLVTTRVHGGALPQGWRWQNGRLSDEAGRLVETPEETDVFHALGLPAWEPRERSGNRITTFFHSQDSQTCSR
jgi:DNA polymerase/3'-5' exonuclease PolX